MLSSSWLERLALDRTLHALLPGLSLPPDTITYNQDRTTMKTTTTRLRATKVSLGVAATAAMVTATAPAVAQRAVIDGGDIDPYEPDLMTDYGMGVAVGGGVTGLIDENARDHTDVGGSWDARFIFGTRSIVAGEIAYLGTGQSVDALGLDGDTALVGNGAEASAHLNFLPGMWQPYLLAGVGYTHYELVGDDFNTSSVADDDDVAHFPLGAGLAFRYQGFMADARGVVRPVAGDEMFSASGGSLNTWGANLSAGAEF